MAKIASGTGAGELMTIGATSKAAYVELRDAAGRATPLQGLASYAATTTPFSPPSSPAPTDMATITGSASKIVRVHAVYFSSTQTSYGTNNIYLVKRSTANSGGTSSSITAVPLDSTSAAATATVLSYTVNPTTGSLVGNINMKRVASPVITTTGMSADIGVDLMPSHRGFELTQPVVLRGTSEVLAVNFAGAALPAGLTVSVTFLFTEE